MAGTSPLTRRELQPAAARRSERMASWRRRGRSAGSLWRSPERHRIHEGMSSTGHPSGSEGHPPGELRTNARLLSLIYDNTSDPVYLVGIETGGQYRFVSVNDSFLRVTGYKRGQVINAPRERVTPSHNVGLVRSQYERAIV